uniref:Uncharacterized protein n=1 Tax=Salix viminalis TaxID=40686 RepID=A0A6N2NHF5_SALVM
MYDVPSRCSMWEKKCEASRNQGAVLGNDGSRGDLQFENNTSWNSQHSFHYNRAPDLGNGQLCQVYQGERPVNGVSSLGAWWMGPVTIVPCDVNPHPVIVLLGSHNKPKVSLMALQLAGVILVPSLTPQTAGGNVHAGALPRLKQLKKIN